MDANMIAHGENFEALPEIYIIFITENDVLKRNLPIWSDPKKLDKIHGYATNEDWILYCTGLSPFSLPLIWLLL